MCIMWESVFFVNLGLLVHCAFVASTVIETPQNTVIYTGQRLSLKCETSNGSYVREWIINRSPGSNGDKIFTNWKSIGLPPVNTGYGFDVDEFGSGELFSNDAQLKHAGKYTCVTEARQMPAEYCAELNVLESEPMCNVTEYAKPNLKVQCLVNFSGNLAPKIEWSYTDLNGIKNGTDGSTEKGYTYTLDAVIAGSSLALSFTLHFDRPNPTSGMATNVPNFTYIWNFNESDIVEKRESVATTVFAETSVLSLSPGFSSLSPGVGGNQASDGTPKSEDRTLMTAVVALSSALVLLMLVALAYTCRKLHVHRKLKIAAKNPVNTDGEAGKERGFSGIYDTIEYDAIGYEMLGNVSAFDALYETSGRNDKEFISDGIPSGYDYPDKESSFIDDKQMILSSEYITTLPDSDAKRAPEILKSGRQSEGVDNKYMYTPLSEIKFRKREQEKDDISVEKTRNYIEIIDDATDNNATDISKDDKKIPDKIVKCVPLSKVDRKPNSGKDSSTRSPPNSYIEIIYDTDGRKTVEKATVDQLSSSSEGEEGNPKESSDSTTYTQLMLDTEYTKLVAQ